MTTPPATPNDSKSFHQVGAHTGPDRRTGPNRRHAQDAGDIATQLSIQALGQALLEKQVTMLRAEVLKLKDVCRGCAGFSDHD